MPQSEFLLREISFLGFDFNFWKVYNTGQQQQQQQQQKHFTVSFNNVGKWYQDLLLSLYFAVGLDENSPMYLQVEIVPWKRKTAEANDTLK